MKSPRVVASILLLTLPLLATHAKPGGFSVETNVNASASLFTASVAAEPNLVWNAPWLGLRAGGGVRVIVGASEFDASVIPFLRGEIGWFYTNVGWVAPVYWLDWDAYHRYLPGISVTAGIAPDLVQFGYGRLGFDLGVEVCPPIFGPDASITAATSLAQQLELPQAIADAVIWTLAYINVRFGLLYTFDL